MKILTKLSISVFFIFSTFFASSATMAQNTAGSTVVRPVDYKPKAGDLSAGEKLFFDKKLSTNGMSCATCHANNASFLDSFAKPYPHQVAMANDALQIKTIYLDEMIQACLIMPMQAQPLPWSSDELADLTSYMTEIQKTFKSKNHSLTQ